MFKVGDIVKVIDRHHGNDKIPNEWEVVMTNIDRTHRIISIVNTKFRHVTHENVRADVFTLIRGKKKDPPKNEIEFLDRVKDNFKAGV